MADITSATKEVGQAYELLADFSGNTIKRNNLQILITSHESVELAHDPSDPEPFYTLPPGFTQMTLHSSYPRGKVYARVSGNQTRSLTINIW